MSVEIREEIPGELSEAAPGGPDEARYQEEGRRLLGILHTAAKARGRSIRSLERAVGVGDSVFAKVVSGKVIPQLRHIYLMCDALGLDWGEFFAMAYPEVKRLEEDKEKQRLIRNLIELGLLPPDYPRKSPPLSVEED